MRIQHIPAPSNVPNVFLSYDYIVLFRKVLPKVLGSVVYHLGVIEFQVTIVSIYHTSKPIATFFPISDSVVYHMVSSNCTCASYDTATTNIAHFTGSNLDYVSFLLPSHVRPSRTSRSEAFRMRTSSSKVRQFPCVKPLRTCSVTCIHNNPYKFVHHESPHRIARLSKCIYLKLQSARSTVLLAVPEEHAPRTASRVDAIVSATWPDPVTEPELHNIVQTFMTHKDCKKHHRVCYREGQSVCSKRFPKPPQSVTTFDSRGYPLYKRSEQDSDIVPYNAILLLLFFAHINIEVCTMANIISYVYA